MENRIPNRRNTQQIIVFSSMTAIGHSQKLKQRSFRLFRDPVIDLRTGSSNPTNDDREIQKDKVQDKDRSIYFRVLSQ